MSKTLQSAAYTNVKQGVSCGVRLNLVFMVMLHQRLRVARSREGWVPLIKLLFARYQPHPLTASGEITWVEALASRVKWFVAEERKDVNTLIQPPPQSNRTAQHHVFLLNSSLHPCLGELVVLKVRLNSNESASQKDSSNTGMPADATLLKIQPMAARDLRLSNLR
jgi:hypothetical protein